MLPLGLIDTQQPIVRAHPLARGLSGWWLTIPQWYGGNKWYDLCGMNNATLTGMTAGFGWQPSTRPGGYGSLSGDGTNDYVIGGPTKTQMGSAFSFALWVKLSGAQSSKGILQWANGLTDGNPWVLFQRETSTTARWFLNGNYRITHTSVADNVWIHFAVTYDGTTWTAYRNGISEGTYVGALGANAGASCYIGNGFNGYSSGMWDDRPVWTRALSAAEVWALYTESRLGYPGLLRRLPLGLIAGDAAPPLGQSVAEWMFHHEMRREIVRAVPY